MDTSSKPKAPIIQIETGQPKPMLPPAKTTAAPAPANPLAGLARFVGQVTKRQCEVEALFKEKPELSPVKNPEFKKFVGDILAEVSMRYVVFGQFKSPNESETAEGSDPVEQKLREQGFNISASQVSNLDPALRGNPAALLAIEGGADLNGDNEEKSERLT